MNLKNLEATQFKTLSSVVQLKVEHYSNNRIALQAIVVESDDEDTIPGEEYAMLTVNIPGTPLAEDEIIIKNWSENEYIAQDAFNTGLFEDTGRRIATGFVQAPVWRIK